MVPAHAASQSSAWSLRSAGIGDEAGGRLTDAMRAMQRALVLDRRTGDRNGAGLDLGNIGYIDDLLGDVTAAMQSYSQAFQVFGQAGDRRGEALTAIAEGSVERRAGRYADAFAYYEQALMAAPRDHRIEASAFYWIGLAELLEGDFNGALRPLRRALALEQHLGSPGREARVLLMIGITEMRLQRNSDAVRACERAAELYEQSGNQGGVSHARKIIAFARLGLVSKYMKHFSPIMGFVGFIAVGVGALVLLVPLLFIMYLQREKTHP